MGIVVADLEVEMGPRWPPEALRRPSLSMWQTPSKGFSLF